VDPIRRVSQRHEKPWFEAAVASLTNADSQASLGEALSALACNEGYENLVLTSCSHGLIDELHWMDLPDGFADAYVAYGWVDLDPVLKHLKRARGAFSWHALMSSGTHAPSAHQMMAAAAAHGVLGGTTVPLHGPGGTCSLISLSQRSARHVPNPVRSEMLNFLALYSLTRFTALESADGAAKPAHPASTNAGTHRRLDPPQLHELMLASPGRPFALTLRHIRELVRVEIGARRWQMGLTEFGSHIYRSRNKGEIADLERWGLVVDVADDDRWLFHLAPSVLGWVYLRRRAEVERLRHQIWNSEVNRREVPDQMDNL